MNQGLGALALKGVGLDAPTVVAYSSDMTTRELLQQALAGNRDAAHLLMERLAPALERWAACRLQEAERTGRTPAASSLLLVVRKGLAKALSIVGKTPTRQGEGALLLEARDWILAETANTTPGMAASQLVAAVGEGAVSAYERALACLPDEEREAVVLRLELDYPLDVLADALGLGSETEARRLVTRSVLRLSQLMESS